MLLFYISIFLIILGLYIFFFYRGFIARFNPRKTTEEEYEYHRKDVQLQGKILLISGIILLIISIIKFFILLLIKIF
jgi:heme/copper-type cytochrome/quinol oxidase subunit 2